MALDWAARSGLELLESYHEGLINTDPEEFLVVLHYHKSLGYLNGPYLYRFVQSEILVAVGSSENFLVGYHLQVR